jgi:type IV secretion system protein VirB4
MNRWFEAAGASSELISIDRFVDSHVFATQSGAYGGTFRLNGRDPECLSDAELADISARLVQAMRLLPENGSLYQILVKRRGCDLPLSRYAEAADETVAETQRQRHAYLAARHCGTVDLYWTVSIHPPQSRKPPKPAEHAVQSEHLLRQLRNTVLTLEQNLSDLIGFERLDCHEIGRLYGHLANLDPQRERRRLSSLDRVNRQLARSPVIWHSHGLTIGRRQARLFSLMQRPAATRPNLFGDLLRLDADLILVLESQRHSTLETRRCVSSHQSFRDLFRHSLLSVLAHAKSGREIAKSANTVGADKALDDLGAVVDDIENRGLTYAQASLIGLLHSSSEAELDDQMAQVHRVFGQSDAAVLEEGIGSLSAYYSLFPAASRYGQSFNVRRWWVREDHLANLSLVYAPYTGEPQSEALEDEALAVFETRDRTPFHFDPYQNGLRGLLVIGSPRRGKSFLINFLMDMEPKYGGFIFVFDIGGSYESTVLKYGGRVVRFGLGGPRLNPFAVPPTAENIEFLYRLMRLLLVKGGAALQPTEERDLYERVQAIYSLSPEIRRLRHLVLAPHLQPYLAKWIEGGVYGRIFDNVEDELQLARIVVFDFQAVEGEEHRDLMEPLLLWIRWQTAAVIHDPAHLGVPKVEVFDECWKHMQDPTMLSLILRSSKTAGKHLGGIILATHAVDDLGAHTRLIRNACTDTLFLGGPFDRAQYRELFGLHERQLDLIAGLQRGESLLVRPEYAKVLVTSVDAESAWRYTTRPKDRARREEAIQRYGRQEAFAQLAANGTAK